MNRKMQWSLHSYNFDADKNVFKEKIPDFSEEYEDTENGLESMAVDGVLMETAFGVFIKDDDLNPYKHFEFWLGHTNFDITKEVKEILMTTPGIEVLEIVSRYRFIIGIGQLFSFHEVRVDLQNKLCGTSIDVQAISNRVLELREQLSDYPDWAMYIFPNGEIDFCYLDKDKNNLDDFNNKKQLLIQARNLSKGELYLYEPLGDSITQKE